MTGLAPGRVLRCDYAACNEPATVEVDAWAYCVAHAGRAHADDAALVITAQGAALSPAPKLVAQVDEVQQRRAAATAAHPSPKAGAAAPPGPSTTSGAPGSPIGRLLEDASTHTIAKVRRLAGRIEQQLDELRALLAKHEAAEAARRARAAEQQQARAEVARLEAALAQAKAKLKKPTAGAVTRPAGQPAACVDCGTPIVRPPGQRGVLPKRCPAHRGKTSAGAA